MFTNFDCFCYFYSFVMNVTIIYSAINGKRRDASVAFNLDGRRATKETWKFLWQMAILAGLFWGSDWLVRTVARWCRARFWHRGTFFLCSQAIIKEQQISTAANFLLKHMVFFFVPVAVGSCSGAAFFMNMAGHC